MDDLTQAESTDIVKVVRGRGRPPRDQDKHAAKVQSMLEQMVDHLPATFEKLKDLIDGVFVEEVDSQGNRIKIYQRPPSIEAVKVLLDRAMGKVSSPISVEGTVDVNHNVIEQSISPEDRQKLLQIALEETQKELTEGSLPDNLDVEGEVVSSVVV